MKLYCTPNYDIKGTKADISEYEGISVVSDEDKDVIAIEVTELMDTGYSSFAHYLKVGDIVLVDKKETRKFGQEYFVDACYVIATSREYQPEPKKNEK